MKTILAELNAIDRVLGSFLFHEEMLIEAMPEIYRSLLPNITNALLRSFAPQKAEHPDWQLNELFIRFESGLLFLYRSESYFLVVLCEPEVKLPFLKVATNVAKMKIAQYKENTAHVPPHKGVYPSAQPIVQHPSGTHRPLGTPSQSIQPEHLSGGWTLSSGAFVPPEAIPPDAIGETTIKRLTRVLASVIGPVAKVVMKRCLNQLGAFAKTVTYGQKEALLGLLEREIDDANDRMRFKDLAHELFVNENIPVH